MRAMAHPVRIALIEALLVGGAMTATEVGEQIGESPTTCSFHLRQLAKYGFVEEAGGGHGRARPWRLSSIGMSLSPGGDAEAEIATDAVMNLFRERQFARYQAWRQTKASYPASWRKAANDSAYVFYLTSEELEQLNQEVGEVLMRWFRFEERLEDPSRRPPDSVPVEAILLAYPTAPPKPVHDAELPSAADRKGQPA
jgi:DNA-binding MarR family transcriptional regulator